MYKLSLNIFLIITIFSLIGCGGYIDISKVGISSQPKNVLYSQGLDYLQNRRFSDAYNKFKEISVNFPFSEDGRKALLMSAFVKYSIKEYSKAAAIGKQYIDKYPRYPNIDYVYYLIGVCYANMIRDVSYDQLSSISMIEYMNKIVKEYPGSNYVESARFYIRLGRNQLAAKEMDIGRYYLQNKEYTSAILRFHNVVREYFDTEQIEEALARIIEVYVMMGLVNEASNVSYILQNNYPQGFWCQYAKKIMKSIP
ncbi:outer membrane protein assembly factor BamD [Candidatus Liberibacter americanus]|uniref:outer membrane protein assembly factor BamD n=1 Tax=Candidatus Liberibacter americanus TaxID=309868 RepID=UPI0002C613FA|nr:outer membrane protein assembly factor BamD [Candidatus Liberibacter americanus]EMS36010.1 outer membrane assembly lipoprotein YfiO [Candidatus Liberibacter americanus PW_SP]